jgi:hypothetical protein
VVRSFEVIFRTEVFCSRTFYEHFESESYVVKISTCYSYALNIKQFRVL